ncbi:TniQ family protein [Ureibacillus sp. MALMAid1270]|uniref:TniQ family protein n=1 Tax=Ureibacillus sp. MALMAid1270 TaxID=3411629 RepID=UPI003BA595BF
MIQVSIRVRPYEDELFSSFIIRLATANGIDILKFCSSFDNNISHYVQRSDMDLMDFSPLSILDIDKLARMVNVDRTLLLNGTFLKMITKFSDSNYSRVRNITDLVKKKLCYCSDCLYEGNYYRTIWKLEGVNGCLKHNKILFDKCMSCNEVILYKEINSIGECPHCGFLLKRSIDKNPKDEEIDKNTISSWNFLLNNSLSFIENNEMALKLLFLLNEFNDVLDRDLISKNLNTHTSLPTLLQHARGTITKNKNLHLKIVLNILGERNTNLKQLLYLEVPQTFRNELKIRKKIDTISCIAPWCSSFEKWGSLIKTGTSMKRKKDETELKYYLLCKDCGCEYALNNCEQLVERSNFISAYNKLVNHDFNNLSLKTVSTILNMPIDKTRRIIAYFTSRDGKVSLNFQGFTIESNKLLKFIQGIREGQQIKQIRQWDIWMSYSEFLLYRYHIDVINELTRNQRKPEEDTRNISNKSSNYLLVKKIVDDMFKNDEDITIKNVSKKIRVAPETVRNWGCNNYIAQIKQYQRSYRLDKMREDIKSKLEIYLEVTPPEQISSKGLYEYLNIGRTVLWRIDKDLTRYIAYKLGFLREAIE